MAVFCASMVQGFVTNICSKQGCQAERAFPASITAVMNTNLGRRCFWQDLLVAGQTQRNEQSLERRESASLQKNNMITMTSSLQATLARIPNAMKVISHFTQLYSWLSSA